MYEHKICGADTETVQGACWLFSTEFGVWEVNSFSDLIHVLYGPKHAKKWKSGRGDGRRAKRGISTKEFFFWNLKFDAQAVFHYLPSEVVERLLLGDKVRLNIDLEGVGPTTFDLKYIEGKHLSIVPKNWMRGQYKFGPCYWWDISQFYHKMRLDNAARTFLGLHKIERCFDGTTLDVTQFDDPDYRDMYREDIEKYAIYDAVLAGKLARLKRSDYNSQDIRFIRPYSLANVAQRNLLDICEVPTINDYVGSDRRLTRALNAANSAFTGGWFETVGSGYLPDVTACDLTSAYPYVMYWLHNIAQGAWIRGDEDEAFWDWAESSQAYSIGFCEAFILFAPNLPWYPLVKKSRSGTLVAPQMIRGWFTASELLEAREWPHTQFILGEWMYFAPENPEDYPFRDFIDRFYELKENSPKNSVAYQVAKIQLNSIFGKTRQAVENRAGKLWNPFYASTICGATRARLAELIRLNDFSAMSVATDGVIHRTDDLHTIPNRPLPAPYTLGQWEMDGQGDALIAMSGVYSLRDSSVVKTLFRGSASYHLRPYQEGGLFRFCEDHADETHVRAVVKRPISAREARIRQDFSLMNRFEERTFTFAARGDSTKRLWPGAVPSTFGDLRDSWWPSVTHRQLE